MTMNDSILYLPANSLCPFCNLPLLDENGKPGIGCSHIISRKWVNGGLEINYMDDAAEAA